MEAFLPYLPFTLIIIAATVVAMLNKINNPLYFIVFAFLLSSVYPNKAKAADLPPVGVYQFTYNTCPVQGKGKFVVFGFLFDDNGDPITTESGEPSKAAGCYDYVGDKIVINWAFDNNGKLGWTKQEIPKKDMKKINSKEVAI